VLHNTCEDSLLASPLIIDLVVLCELCERISIRKLPSVSKLQLSQSRNDYEDSTLPSNLYKKRSFVENEGTEPQYERFHSVLSILSYLLKAPVVPHGTPVVNALAAQRMVLRSFYNECAVYSKPY